MGPSATSHTSMNSSDVRRASAASRRRPISTPAAWAAADALPHAALAARMVCSETGSGVTVPLPLCSQIHMAGRQQRERDQHGDSRDRRHGYRGQLDPGAGPATDVG